MLTHSLIENLKTLNRSNPSIHLPNTDDSSATVKDRTSAYTEVYSKVSGNAETRNSTAPNSNMREFQVERKCEM